MDGEDAAPQGPAGADYDRAPPMPVESYREFQRFIPGLEAHYALVRAVLDSRLGDGARILIVAAGGGREVEALVPSPRRYRLVGVDPSADMLAVAARFVGSAHDRVTLVQGLVEDLPDDPQFDAATAGLVLHFLPDDGAKLAFLRAIGRRLRARAPFLLTDTTIDDAADLEWQAAALAAHAAGLGLPAAVAEAAAAHMARASAEGMVVPEARQRALFAEAGFRLVAPFFRGLWFAGWWLERDDQASV